MRQSQQKSSAFLVCCNVKEASMANSVDPDQTAPRAVCSGSTLFAFILNLSVMFRGNVRQFFAADDFSRLHFQIHFFLGALRVNLSLDVHISAYHSLHSILSGLLHYLPIEYLFTGFRV